MKRVVLSVCLCFSPVFSFSTSRHGFIVDQFLSSPSIKSPTKTGHLFHRVSPLVVLIFTFTFVTPTEKGLIDHRDHLGLEQIMQLPKRGSISAGDEDTNTITKHEP